jgi:transposase
VTPLDAMKDVETLRTAAKILDRENERLIHENLKLQRENLRLKGGGDLQQRMEELERQLALLRQDKFGDSSEKRPAPKAEKPEPKPQTGHGPREQKSLERVEEIHLLDEPDKTCPKCGGDLKEWAGQFEESEEVDVIPRRWIVRHHKRQKYRCACQACVETALGVPKLIPGGRYSPDFAVDVAVSKYLDHMPLERQVRAMAREGLVVDSNTLWDQINALARHLAPVHERLHAYVLSKPVIGTDETHWKYLGPNGAEHPQKRWQAWTVVTDDAVSYRIVPSRSADAAREVFGGFRGIMMVDGYGVYEHLAKHDGIVLANCWAHVRRKFFELENSAPAAVRDEILDLIGELYAVERDANGDREVLARLREDRSRAAITRIRAWLFAQKARALPRSALGKAVDYALERWSGLTRFVDDPRIPIDNNASERALRGPVVGRKNHYGSKSERGTQVAALLYSLCESAKLACIDPRVYLRGAIWSALRGEEVWLPHEVRANAAALPRVDG